MRAPPRRCATGAEAPDGGRPPARRERFRRARAAGILAALLLAFGPGTARAGGPGTLPAAAWPSPTRQSRPWTYWWWMGSAVDRTNLTHELQRYHDAGVGGVHIIPIYGARGYEERFIPYLTPRWMEMLAWTVAETARLDLGVDMTTGSGWCFGGPRVTDQDANALLVVKAWTVAAGGRIPDRIDRAGTQALMAFPTGGEPLDLLPQLGADGGVDWSPATGSWRVYRLAQRPSGVQVKRAGPGGQGHMLNLLHPAAMTNYLDWFEQAFAGYHGPLPRALYHDSYEYRSEWAPDFLASFERRRGYRLQDQWPAFFEGATLHVPSDQIARVKCDYRETVSDLMAEETLPAWTAWAHRRGLITRNEAHGSPGNLLDLYAAADIPETEMFNQDRDKLVSKMASSAAHLKGGLLVSAETGTWLKEHFTGTLADMKYLADDMFLAGINHLFYHGTCYSPDDAPWPGWMFYASFDMNPRNSIWHDVRALNDYAARCQAVLQSGLPDNDVLLYWPIHDYWQEPGGTVRPMTVHARGWLGDQPVGKAAALLWRKGYAFDFVSDRLLGSARAGNGRVQTPGGTYQAIVVPAAKTLPAETMARLVHLAEAGATVVFEAPWPTDVPGWGRLEERRTALRHDLAWADALGSEREGVRRAAMGSGRILAGRLEPALIAAGVRREPMFDHEGLMCVRRRFDGGCYYFIANRTEDEAVHEPVALGSRTAAAMIMDPLTGRSAAARIAVGTDGSPSVRLDLEPGQSLLLKAFDEGLPAPMPTREPDEPAGAPLPLAGEWRVEFLAGGPDLPPPFTTRTLGSWTVVGGTNAVAFAGTACYRLVFDAPAGCGETARLDLGQVWHSARVRLNDEDLGTLIAPPFRVTSHHLKPVGNRLEIDVTNTSANRLRDLDRRGVKWRNFYDINVVGLDYKPLDASRWPIAAAGLGGPVTVTPLR